MKSILLACCLLTGSASHAATWTVNLHAVHDGELFDVKGKLTTAGTALPQKVTSFSGSITDALGTTSALTYVVPPDRKIVNGDGKNGLFGPYDNTLYSTYPPDAFNNGGLLLSTKLGYVQLLCITPGLIAYHYKGPAVFSAFVDGSITLDSK